MTSRHIAIRRVSVSPEQLQGLPEFERNLLFLAGHVLNEINALNKAFIWSLGTSTGDDVSRLKGLAQGVQALIFARVLAGKLFEAWEELKSSWSRNKLALRLAPSLHPIAAESLTHLKKYFGKRNAIARIRNSVGFHYSASALGRTWRDAVGTGNYDCIFGGTISNNLNLSAEAVANAAMLEIVGKSSVEESLQSFFEEVQGISEHMTTFLEGVTHLLLERALGVSPLEAAATDSVTTQFAFDEIHMPHFCAPSEA